MEQRNFGNTDLTCSALGFGTWELGTTQYGEIDVDEAVRAVHMAIDHGVTLFDTAEVYGPFTSEELLARGLGQRRKDIVLVTKVGFVFHDDPTVVGDAAIVGRNAAAAYISERTEGCLKRLNTDYIDLMLIHWPDHKTPHDETLGALEAMKAGRQDSLLRGLQLRCADDAGLPGRWAVSRRIRWATTWFDRRMEAAVLPYCLEQGIGFMAYGSLAFGLVDRRADPRHHLRGQ